MSYPYDPNAPYPPGQPQQPPYGQPQPPPNYPPGQYPPSAPYPPSGYPPSAPYPPGQYPPSAPYPPSGYPPSAPYPPSQYPPSAPFPPGQYPPTTNMPPSRPYQPSPTFPGAEYGQGGGQPPVFNPAPAPRRSPVGRILAVVGALLVVIIIGTGVSLALRGIGSKISNLTGDGSYSTTTPGKGCDKGKGTWDVAKTLNYSQTCQSDGTVLTRTTKDTFYSELFFAGVAAKAFPQSYQMSVQSTITSGGSFTFVGLMAHSQAENGGQIFEVSSGGVWDVYGVDTSGQSTRLAIGFLKAPATTYALELDVDGAVMQFLVNGQLVTTFTDDTFSATDNVAITFIGEQDDQTTQSAKFTQFAYKPKGNASLVPAQAAATATAQASSTAPYTAAKPGPNCDTGTAQWAAPSLFGNTDTQLSCGATGLVVSQTASATSETGARFYNQNGNFPQNYSISATVQTNQLGGGCAGLSARNNDNGRYTFLICDGDGYWGITKEPTNATSGTPLRQGHVKVKGSYIVKATITGSTLTMAIDNVTVGTTSDSAYTTTSFLQLLMFAGDGVAGSATFSNFVYTPMA